MALDEGKGTGGTNVIVEGAILVPISELRAHSPRGVSARLRTTVVAVYWTYTRRAVGKNSPKGPVALQPARRPNPAKGNHGSRVELSAKAMPPLRPGLTPTRAWGILRRIL